MIFRQLIYSTLIANFILTFPANASHRCEHYFTQEVVHALHDFRDDVKKYWAEEAKSLLLKSPSEPLENFLTYYKNGLQFAFAPTFFTVDVLAAAPFRAYTAGKQKSFIYKGARWLLVPVDIAQRNGAHLALYLVLGATAFSIPYLILDDASFLDDLNEIRPHRLPLKPDEIAVFINSTDRITRDAIAQAHINANYPPTRVVKIENNNPAEILLQLKELRKKGRIRDLSWSFHGAEGIMNGNAEGDWDIEEDHSGVINSERLSELKKIVESWPADLFAPEARLTLFSCSVAKGKTGEQFTKDLGVLVLQNGGTVIAPSVALSTLSREEGMGPVKNATSAIPQNGEQLFNFFLIPSLAFLKSAAGIGTAMDLIFNENEQKIKVIKIPHQQ